MRRAAARPFPGGAAPAAALLLAAAGALSIPSTARAVYECGGEVDSCPCGRDTPCICCECGNCVWWAWHEACCNWGRALEWCTDAGTWDNYAESNGYPRGSEPRTGAIFVCEPSSSCSSWGHVGWLTNGDFADGSFDTTEQSCGGYCGVRSRHREAGYADSFIYNPSGPPPDPDNDGDGYKASGDCDDSNASVHPGADEKCNGRDDDCDGAKDEGCAADEGVADAPGPDASTDPSLERPTDLSMDGGIMGDSSADTSGGDPARRFYDIEGGCGCALVG